MHAPWCNRGLLGESSSAGRMVWPEYKTLTLKRTCNTNPKCTDFVQSGYQVKELLVGQEPWVNRTLFYDREKEVGEKEAILNQNFPFKELCLQKAVV